MLTRPLTTLRSEQQWLKDMPKTINLQIFEKYAFGTFDILNYLFRPAASMALAPFKTFPTVPVTTMLQYFLRSLDPKLDELSVILQQGHIGIAAITETWFGDHIPKEKIEIAGYKCFREDRKARKAGGGVVIYVRDNDKCKTKEWKELYEEEVESVWVTIFPQKLPRQVTNITVGARLAPLLEQTI